MSTRVSFSSSSVLVGFLACLAVASGGCGDEASGPGMPLKVLSWNIYLGTDLSPLAGVPTRADIPAVTAPMWAAVKASDFPERAKIIAARIAELGPDLVALQEVSLYRLQTPSDFATVSTPNATAVELDFLDLIMAELGGRAVYHVVVAEPNADVELPVSDGAGGLFDLRVTDRDVILARGPLPTAGGVQQPFLSKLNLTVGGPGGVPLAFTRSESQVHVSSLRPFTFATSHLEIGALAAVQSAQAMQLVDFMDAIWEPVVLVGDFNTAPGMPNYQALTASFHDLAASLPPPATDFTCCQAGDLMNNPSAAGERIDLVLTRGNFTMKSLTLVGTDPVHDRTPGGQWASDHFGVVAELELR